MASWLDEFTPNEYVSTVYDIDLDKLWSDGKRAILTDLDNTLVPWNDDGVPEPLRDWLTMVETRGFQVCIVSNNKGPRVASFAKSMGVKFVSGAKKPKPDAFMAATKKLGVAANETAMLGDQLFTDIRGGNRCGMYTVLVLPIHPREWWGTQVVRVFERRLMKLLIRRGLRVPARNMGSVGGKS